MMKTISIVSELDYLDMSMKKMFYWKMNNFESNEKEAYDIAKKYHQGILDPGRAVAKIEAH